MTKTLHIIRGASGSGKSTLAKSLVSTDYHFEADQYFTDSDGNYKWEATLVPNAHQNCERRVHKAMARGETPLAVSNTFTRHWEYKSYVTLAKVYEYTVIIHVCRGKYQNIHNVPQSIVQEMRDRFEE